MDTDSEKLTKLQERLQSIETFLGIAERTVTPESDRSTDVTTAASGSQVTAPTPAPKSTSSAAPPAATTSGGFAAIREELAAIKLRIGDFETLLHFFPMEVLLEALRDLDELRGKLLRKTSRSK